MIVDFWSNSDHSSKIIVDLPRCVEAHRAGGVSGVCRTVVAAGSLSLRNVAQRCASSCSPMAPAA